MKKTLGAVLVAAIVAVPLAAQPPMRSTGGLALKGGFSYGNVSNSGVFPGEARERTGGAIGLALVSGGVMGFGIEGLYAQRGITSSAVGGSRELDYIDVPLYLRVAAANPALEPFLYAGPQASFELKCGANGGSCPSGRPKTTYAGVIGGGVRLGALNGISLEGRYVYGLTDLKLTTVSDSESYKTRSFLILVGLGL
jgi:hypothetical protein